MNHFQYYAAKCNQLPLNKHIFCYCSCEILTDKEDSNITDYVVNMYFEYLGVKY